MRVMLSISAWFVKVFDNSPTKPFHLKDFWNLHISITTCRNALTWSKERESPRSAVNAPCSSSQKERRTDKQTDRQRAERKRVPFRHICGHLVPLMMDNGRTMAHSQITVHRLILGRRKVDHVTMITRCFCFGPVHTCS